MMQPPALIAACIILAGTAIAVPVRPPGPSAAAATESYGFDYVHLVQEWPGSFCDTKKGYLSPRSRPPSLFPSLLPSLPPSLPPSSFPLSLLPPSPPNSRPPSLTDSFLQVFVAQRRAD